MSAGAPGEVTSKAAGTAPAPRTTGRSSSSEDTPSFSHARERYVMTVDALSPSAAATCATELPVASASAIARSRSLSASAPSSPSSGEVEVVEDVAARSDHTGSAAPQRAHDPQRRMRSVQPRTRTRPPAPTGNHR